MTVNSGRDAVLHGNHGARAPHVSLVKLSGAGDSAETLRRRYRLPDGAFRALLIGKDGRVVLRSAGPIAAGQMRGTIDAMPMRKAGQR